MVDCTTADTSTAAGELVRITHEIEGFKLAPFISQTCTLQFWVKATKTGTSCVSFVAGGLNFISEYTINSSDTWEKKTITFLLEPSILGVPSLPNVDNSSEFTIGWILTAGTTFIDETVDTWISGNFHATSNQVNHCDSTANDFRLTGVSLRIGTDTSNISRRIGYIQQLQDCQRYYQKSYNLTDSPGTATQNSIIRISLGTGTVDEVPVLFPVRMRAAPSVTVYAIDGTAGSIHTLSGGNQTAVVQDIGESGFHTNITGTVGSGQIFHFEATARF